MSAGQDLFLSIWHPKTRVTGVSGYGREKSQEVDESQDGRQEDREEEVIRFTVDGSAGLYSSRDPVTTAIRPSILLGLFAFWERINGPASPLAKGKNVCAPRDPPRPPLTKGGNLVVCEWANGTPRVRCYAGAGPDNASFPARSRFKQTAECLLPPFVRGGRGGASFAFLESSRLP